jgi:cytochrome P450
VLGRVPLHDVKLGDYTAPEGMRIRISPWLTQRDARYFPEPERFLPDRWLNAPPRPKFAYFPFGGGERICLGESFANQTGVIALAAFARKWRFELACDHVVAEPALVLPPKELPMALVSRASVRTT